MALPYSTKDFMGCGGIIKSQPEDFFVEEIPSYLPSGNGEHIYLLIEKKGISTREAIKHICSTLGLSEKKAGHAGLKDSSAITRQWISLHLNSDFPLSQVETDNIKIMEAGRHGNKLRPGHLRGNRFKIVIRNIDDGADLGKIVQSIEMEGFPNYFGPQRMGNQGINAKKGNDLVKSGFSHHQSINITRFNTNAYQSALFNELVAFRLESLGSLGKMLVGDLAVMHNSKGFFSVLSEELSQAEQRSGEQEISPSAPLFGYKVPLASGEPGEWEEKLLEAEGLVTADFKQGGKRLSPKGVRRSVRAFPLDFYHDFIEIDGKQSLSLQFQLGAGVYATSLLRELMKNDNLEHFINFPLIP